MGGRSGRTGCAIGWVGQEGKDWDGQEGEDCGGHEGETVCVCDMRGRLCVRGERRGGLCVGVKGGRTVWTARVGQYGGPYAEEGMGQTETLCNLECSVCIFIGILLLYSSFLRTVNASLKIL